MDRKIEWKVGYFKRTGNIPTWYVYGWKKGESAKRGDTCYYMHRSGRIHTSCGDPGFFDSEAEASKMIPMISHPFKPIKDNLFKI